MRVSERSRQNNQRDQRMSDNRKLQTDQIPAPADFGPEVVISPDTLAENSLPPRQVRTRKWPVLDAFGPSEIDLDEWEFEVIGLVESPAAFTWEEFKKLPRIQVFADMHCVTRWSRLGNLWEGVSTAEVLAHVKVLPQARYVLVHAHDGDWTTNMPPRRLPGPGRSFCGYPRRRTYSAGARRTAAPCDSPPLRLEERQMGQGH